MKRNLVPVNNYIIRNAMVLDGSGKAPSLADVGVKDGRIAAVGKGLSSSGADKIIDAGEKFLCPGFIDSHGHSDVSIIASPEAIGKISQGVTTEVVGNCGLSVFPITAKNCDHLKDLYKNYNTDISWNTIKEYALAVNKARPAINIASLCGHNTIRASISGYDERLTDKRRTGEMRVALRKCLEEGAIGFSTGLIYVPGKFSKPEEVQELLEELAVAGKPYSTHLRSEGKYLLEAVEEAIESARKSQCPHIHISHLKTSGKTNWWKIDYLLSIISSHRSNKFSITGDRYPYCESMTQLSSYLTSPYDDLNDTELCNSMQNPDFYAELVKALGKNNPDYWKEFRLVSTSAEKYSKYSGETFQEISRQTGMMPPVIFAEILKEDSVSATASSGSMSAENMMKILKEDWICCGSDESARPLDYSIGRCHPRGFGSFPKFIRLLYEEIGLEEAIRKTTSLPAGIFGFKDRGLIKEGYAADMVLFDMNSLSPKSDFKNPHALSGGILKVWVNGALSWDEGKAVGRAGRFLI